MADGEGGGSEEWLSIYNRVEAMLSKSQAREEALAADRARQEAADRVQRGSLEAARRLQRSVEELRAAAREKDAEVEMLRAEASDARKKLQADASKRGMWEAAYLDLLLGANQKLAELRDGDLEDSRTLAETPNSKETENCTKLNQSTMDHIASDLSTELRKLKHAYETLSSKKDKEVSALLSGKDSVSNQLSIMQQDYANKKLEAAQGTEAALKLQQSVDELMVLAQKKDDEIGRLQADAVEAKRNLQKMQSLVKEKGDEIQRLKGRHPESIEKRKKVITEARTNFRSDDPAARSKSKNTGLMQIAEDCISQARTIGKDWQDEPRQKRRRISFISNDDEQSGSDEDDDEPLGTPERKRDACTARFANGKATVKAIVTNNRTPPLPANLPSSRDVLAICKLQCYKKLFCNSGADLNETKRSRCFSN